MLKHGQRAEGREHAESRGSKNIVGCDREAGELPGQRAAQQNRERKQQIHLALSKKADEVLQVLGQKHLA